MDASFKKSLNFQSVNIIGTIKLFSRSALKLRDLFGTCAVIVKREPLSLWGVLFKFGKVRPPGQRIGLYILHRSSHSKMQASKVLSLVAMPV